MKQSKWDTTSDIDFETFVSGERLTFVIAEHDTLEQSDGFKFQVYGLLDSQGRFHMLGHSVEPAKNEKQE